MAKNREKCWVYWKEGLASGWNKPFGDGQEREGFVLDVVDFLWGFSDNYSECNQTNNLGRAITSESNNMHV